MRCELSATCEREATVYGGWNGAGSWAGRACDEHAEAAVGFHVWERLDWPLDSTYVAVHGTTGEILRFDRRVVIPIYGLVPPSIFTLRELRDATLALYAEEVA